MPAKAGKPAQTRRGASRAANAHPPGTPAAAPAAAFVPSGVAPSPAAPRLREPAWARLRLAASVAAAAGLVAGEVLNELRRARRLPRRA